MVKLINKVFQDKDYKEILFKSSHFLIFRILGFLIAYGFSFYVIKQYGENVYGFVALSLTIFSILVVYGKMGFDIHLTKKFSAYESNTVGFSFYYISTGLAFVFSWALVALIYFFADEISTEIFSKPKFANYLRWTVLSVPFWVLIMINSGVLRGLRQNGLYAFFMFFSRFFVTLIVLMLIPLLIISEDNLIMESHFFAVLLIFLISCTIIFRLRKAPIKAPNLNNVKRYVSETIPLMSSTYFYVLLLWSDKIILGIFESEVNIGVYDIVTKIAIVITFTYEAINSILAPKISDSFHKDDHVLLQKNIRFSVRTTFYSGLLIFLGILIFHRPVLGFLGEVYFTGIFALMVLCFGKIAISLFGPVSDILQMTGHQKAYSRIMFGTLILNLVLNYFLIKAYGINGAAIATSFAFLCMFFISHIYIKKALKINSFIV